VHGGMFGLKMKKALDRLSSWVEKEGDRIYAIRDVVHKELIDKDWTCSGIFRGKEGRKKSEEIQRTKTKPSANKKGRKKLRVLGGIASERIRTTGEDKGREEMRIEEMEV